MEVLDYAAHCWWGWCGRRRVVGVEVEVRGEGYAA